MGFPAILSALQPFQICIYNRKYSKLTFSDGSQLMGKGLWQICMHHWRVHAKVEFPRFPPDVRTRGVHSTTFDAELRNIHFALISFMGFPAILSALQPFQICIYNRKFLITNAGLQTYPMLWVVETNCEPPAHQEGLWAMCSEQWGCASSNPDLQLK